MARTSGEELPVSSSARGGRSSCSWMNHQTGTFSQDQAVTSQWCVDLPFATPDPQACPSRGLLMTTMRERFLGANDVRVQTRAALPEEGRNLLFGEGHGIEGTSDRGSSSRRLAMHPRAGPAPRSLRIISLLGNGNNPPLVRGTDPEAQSSRSAIAFPRLEPTSCGLRTRLLTWIKRGTGT